MSLFAFKTRSALHLGPQRMVMKRSGIINKYKMARRVYVHPEPMASISGTIATEAPAPREHRTRLLAAVAVAGSWGYISTTRTLNTVKKPFAQKPTKKRNTKGAAT